jgi:hypothetical protein
MSRQIKTILTVTLTAAGCALAPAAASAGSLLSGYGGPGEGSQAVLGSALLNGPPGGGGAAAGTGTAGSSAGAVRHESSATASGSRSGGRVRSSTSGEGQKQAKGGAKSTTTGAGGARFGRISPSYASASAVASQPLGVSGADLMYICLALGGVALTGVVTRQLVAGQSRAPKGISRQTRVSN